MTSSDTLLKYVFKFAAAYNAINDNKITPLQALKIYNEMTKPYKAAPDAQNRPKF